MTDTVPGVSITASDIAIILAPESAASTAERAAALAERLHASLIDGESDRSTLRLAVSDDRIELLLPGMKIGRGVAADYSSIDTRPGKKQPLGRAVGSRTHTVLDATGGLGQDAYLLACLGYRVLAMERSPIVFALLEDGIRRAQLDDRMSRAMGDRLRILQGDAREALQHLDSIMPEGVDAVYIDPMFPPKRNVSALPRKEIQALRAAVGDDTDAAELLEIALGVAKRRVIVKRPDHAPPLREGATTSHERKLVRYDVYTKTSV